MQAGVNGGDLPKAFGVDVSAFLLGRLDLPVGGHDGGQVLRHNLARLDRDHAALAPNDAEDDQSNEDHCDDGEKQDLLPAFLAGLGTPRGHARGDFLRRLGLFNLPNLYFRYLTHGVELLSVGLYSPARAA